MWEDPIVMEVRQARVAYAARFNNNLQAMFADLKKKEQSSGRRVVTLPPRPLETAHAKSTGST
jgi:hypothetical protein